MLLNQAFHCHQGELHCEGVSLSRIAQQFGTPCYVYSKDAILKNYRAFRTSFEALDPLICYAVKANANMAILALLHNEGSGFDVVSGGELYALRKIGADPEKIIFSGVGKTLEELETALEMPLLSLNIESIEELKTFIDLAKTRNVRPRISLRMNPDVESPTHPYVSTGLQQHKFGISMDRIEEIIELLKQSRHVQLVGLGFHIGSQILEMQPFLDAFLELKEAAARFETASLPVRHLDLGGGIGIPYKDEKEPDLKSYAEFLNEHQGEYRIVFEPGRFIVGNTGVLVNKVLYHKVGRKKQFLIVDGAMNDLMRPSLYQAYHEIQPVQQKKEPEVQMDVVGPVCETGDFFAQNRSLPPLKSGDYLAVMNVGAYGFALASNYNSRLRAPEILVDGEDCRLVRQRETYEDLVRNEI